MELKEANSQLLGKTYVIPREVRDFLMSMTKMGGEGSKRINNLLNNPNPTYEQIKRFKHDIENKYQGDWGLVLNWINGVLSTDRDSIYRKKKITKDTGMQNRFIKTHDKNNVIGFGNEIEESIKIMKIKITEHQENLIKKQILQEGENYSRYKTSYLRELLVNKEEELSDKQMEIVSIEKEIENIKLYLQSKEKKQIKNTNSDTEELNDNVSFNVPTLE